MLQKILDKKNILFLCILFAASLAILFFTRDTLQVNPLQGFAFDGTVYAARDEKGSTLVADQAGKRLLKVSPEGGLQWQLKGSAGTFSGILRVLPVGDRIYLQDVQTEVGIRMSGESIIELDSKGKLKGTAAKYLYSERTLQPHIIGLFETEKGVGYLYKLEDRFRLVRLGEGESTYPLEQAGLFMRSASFDPAKGDIYYSTYDGKVFRYVDGISDALLYSSKDSSERSIPNEVFFKDGILYVTDLGLRDVLAIHTDTGETERYAEDLDFYSKEIAYTLNASNGLLAITAYTVKEYLGDYSYEYVTSCHLTFVQKALAVLSKLAFALGVLSLILLLIILTLYLFKNGNVYTKMIYGVVVGAVSISGLIIAVVFPQFQDKLSDAFYERAELASSVVSAQLPKYAFQRLRDADDFMDTDYQEVKKVVTNVFFNNSDSMKDLYCCLYQVVDGVIVMTYSLKDSVGAVYPYDWEYAGSLEEQILTTKEGLKYQTDSSEGQYLFTCDPILDDRGDAIGLIEVGKDMQSHREEIRRMIVDAFVNVMAVTVVQILTVIEVIYFAKGRNEYLKQMKAATEKARVHLTPEIIRMISFLVFFLTNLSTAFLPVYAMNISGSVRGVPPEIMAAIPISAEVITGALFSVLGVSLVGKLGEKKAVFISALLFTAGFALRVFPSIWMLILGNAVMGIGWGVILLCATTRIADLPDDQKDDGFSQYNVAALNGVNCGVVFGGFLIKWVNYQAVFIISALLSLSVLVITGKYFNRGKQDRSEEKEQRSGLFGTLAFILNPQVLILMFMIVAPIMICYYFLNYMYPILGTDYGLTETYIGYSYLLNGLCVMAFGGILTNFFTRTKKKREGLTLASLIYAGAFLLVVYFHNIPSLFAALALLGVSDSFGLPLQTGFFTDLNVVQKFGYGKALGIYNLVVNVAQTIGPFVFSYVLIAGMSSGLTVVLVTLAVLAVLFWVFGNAMDRVSAEQNKKLEV